MSNRATSEAELMYDNLLNFVLFGTRNVFVTCTYIGIARGLV